MEGRLLLARSFKSSYANVLLFLKYKRAKVKLDRESIRKLKCLV